MCVLCVWGKNENELQLPFHLVLLLEQSLKKSDGVKESEYIKKCFKKCQQECNQVMFDNKAEVEASKSSPSMTLKSKKTPFQKNY